MPVNLLVLLCSLLAFVTADAFKSGLPSNRMFRLHSNVIDGVKVNGEITAIHNYVIVKVKHEDKQTASGLIVSVNPKNVRPSEGEAVSVGPGRHHPETGIMQPQVIPLGHNVVFGHYDGAEMTYNGEKYQVIKDDDALFTYTGDKKSLDTITVAKDQVMFRIIERETKTSSGIFITDSDKNDIDKVSRVGEVVKIGPGRLTGTGQLVPVSVKVGDIIRVREAMTQNIQIEGDWYAVARDVEILARFVGTPETK